MRARGMPSSPLLNRDLVAWKALYDHADHGVQAVSYADVEDLGFSRRMTVRFRSCPNS